MRGVIMTCYSAGDSDYKVNRPMFVSEANLVYIWYKGAWIYWHMNIGLYAHALKVTGLGAYIATAKRPVIHGRHTIIFERHMMKKLMFAYNR